MIFFISMWKIADAFNFRIILSVINARLWAFLSYMAEITMWINVSVYLFEIHKIQKQIQSTKNCNFYHCLHEVLNVILCDWIFILIYSFGQKNWWKFHTLLWIAILFYDEKQKPKKYTNSIEFHQSMLCYYKFITRSFSCKCIFDQLFTKQQGSNLILDEKKEVNNAYTYIWNIFIRTRKLDLLWNVILMCATFL